MRWCRFVLWLLLLAPLTVSATTLLVFGDSLSAGYGLQNGQGWVDLLARELGPRIRVVNASQSGETSAGGLTRLPQALAQARPDIVILELGANDGLRGLPLDAMRDNLARMIRLCQRAHARVVLVGVALPPNFGAPYTQAFHAVYDDLSRTYRLIYVPQLMQGFAEDIRQFQPDGLHPAASAQSIMMHTVKSRLPKL